MKYDTNRVLINTLLQDVIKRMGITVEAYAVKSGVSGKTAYNWLNDTPVTKIVAEKITQQALELGLDPTNYVPTSVPYDKRRRAHNKNGEGWDIDRLTGVKGKRKDPNVKIVEKIRKENIEGIGWDLDKLK